MDEGAVEFSSTNFRRVLVCLSPRARFDRVVLHSGVAEVHYGNDNRGAFVTVEFREDEQVGGRLLRVQAHGF